MIKPVASLPGLGPCHLTTNLINGLKGNRTLVGLSHPSIKSRAHNHSVINSNRNCQSCTDLLWVTANCRTTRLSPDKVAEDGIEPPLSFLKLGYEPSERPSLTTAIL